MKDEKFEIGDDVDWLQGEEGRDPPIRATVIGISPLGFSISVEIEVVNSPEVAKVAGPTSHYSTDPSSLRHRKRAKRRWPVKKFEHCEHDASVIRHALVLRLKSVRVELVTLSIAKERNLTQEERWMLPANLQKLSQEELREQIDAWESLRLTIQHLIDEYKVGYGEKEGQEAGD